MIGYPYLRLGVGTGDSPEFAGLSITCNSVFGLDSSVFQPTTDSTTFFQVLDADGGTPIFNIDSTNERVGIGTDVPKRQFDFDGANVRTQRYLDSDLNTNLGYETFGAGNLSGTYNSAFGRQALYSITSGANNCAFGSNSLYGVTSGENNIAMGYNAEMAITEGNHNISLGYKSGYVITIGSNNISIGAYGNYAGTGSKNILVGYNIDLPVDAGDNQLNIGNLIYGTGLDGVDKTVSTGNVGFGVADPDTKLEVLHAGNQLKLSFDGTDNTIFGVDTSGDLTITPSGSKVVVAGEVNTVAWTDYAGTSTLVGWSGTPVKNIWYKKVGNLVFVSFYINGTSDSTTTTFTLPYTNNNGTNAEVDAAIRLWNNGVNSATSGQINLPKNSNIVTCFIDWAAGAFTNANSKVVIGQFWYEAQ